jgi:hypothetical protein
VVVLLFWGGLYPRQRGWINAWFIYLYMNQTWPT